MYTLLEIVQKVLVPMKGMKVNSISDTEEAEDVARIVEDVYMELMSRKNHWEQLKTVGKLTGFNNSAFPTTMQHPSNLREVLSLHYDCRTVDDTVAKWRKLEYLEPEVFFDRQLGLDTDADNVEEVTSLAGEVMYVYNDRAPRYWTNAQGDFVIIMDAYDAELGFQTLLPARTQLIYYQQPPFQQDDDFIPILPPDLFAYLIAESKSVAMTQLLEREDAKSEQQSRRQYDFVVNYGYRNHPGITFYERGRVPRGGRGRSCHFPSHYED